MKIAELLFEGGNAFVGDLAVIRIARAQVKPTVAFLEGITGLSLLNNMLGSTGIKETSGDIDLAVDRSEITKDELLVTIRQWTDAHNMTAVMPAKKLGSSVTMRCPISGNPKNGFVQVDLMFVSDIEFARWAIRANPDSKYKNLVKNKLLYNLAKSMNLRYQEQEGLTTLDTKKLLKNGNNPDFIAKKLLNAKATRKDIESVESIMAALKNDPKKEEKLRFAYPAVLAEVGVDLRSI
jgi:hypothetical protein